MTYQENQMTYCLNQAEETLQDAQRMLQEQVKPRLIVNRGYYSMFYAVLSAFLKKDVTLDTSEHAEIVVSFDKEFIQSGVLDQGYSDMLHKAFEARNSNNNQEFVSTPEQAGEYVELAEKFLAGIKKGCDLK